MKCRRLLLLSAALLGASLAANASAVPNPSLSSAPPPSAAIKSKLMRYQWPLRFEPNRGQTDSSVRFVGRSLGYGLFLRERDAVMVLHTPAGKRGTKDAVVRMAFAGARKNAAMQGRQILPGQSNYLRGQDPRRWHTGIPNFAQVRYDGLYPGIDLAFYGKRQRLEYDYIVSPHADPRQIRLHYSGVRKLSLNQHGDLLLDTGHGILRQHKPVVYQMIGGQKRLVSGHYVLGADKQVGFRIARYDTRQPLIIDPVLDYSTYLGGSGDEAPEGLAVDANGNVYIAGLTSSTNFPLANAQQASKGGGTFDVFVTKLNASGTGLVYSTFLGGNGDDEALGMALDANGSVYVTGETNSTDFPIVNAVQNSYSGTFPQFDAFLSKLTPDGSGLLYSTYLGSSGDDRGFDVAVDGNGNAYVTGKAGGAGFPLLNPMQANFGGGASDAFVSKFSPQGGLIFSTFLGGAGADEGHHLAFDATGNVFIDGQTASTNFPLLNALQTNYGGGTSDAFITKMSGDGARLIFSSYLGGNGNDLGDGLAVGSHGNCYLSGETTSTNFPTKNPIQSSFSGGDSDMFITKVSGDGKSILYSTYLGGSGTDHAHTIAVDGNGDAFLTGHTATAFPLVDPIQSQYGGGGADAVIFELNPSGNGLLFSTYLGGSGVDHGHRIVLDGKGHVFVTGHTASPNFPTKNALQSQFGGGEDVFVLRLSSIGTGTPSPVPNGSGSPSPSSAGGGSSVPASGGGGGGGCTLNPGQSFDPTLIGLLAILGGWTLRRRKGHRR